MRKCGLRLFLKSFIYLMLLNVHYIANISNFFNIYFCFVILPLFNLLGVNFNNTIINLKMIASRATLDKFPKRYILYDRMECGNNLIFQRSKRIYIPKQPLFIVRYLFFFFFLCVFSLLFLFSSANLLLSQYYSS